MSDATSDTEDSHIWKKHSRIGKKPPLLHRISLAGGKFEHWVLREHSSESCNAARQKSFSYLWSSVFVVVRQESANTSVWGEEAMWETIMMEEERQESDCNVTERSRQCRLAENPSGRRTNQQWMCDSCSYFVGWPELPSAPLLWGEDTMDRFSFTGFSKGDILSFPVHSHPTIICVHLDSVWKLILMDFFFSSLFFCFCISTKL